VTWSAEKPDFSGGWIQNREASTLSPGADAVRSGTWRIEHREPTFHHKAAFVFERNPFEYEYELLSDDAKSWAPSERWVRQVTTSAFPSHRRLDTVRAPA
jgi:hypothetical protein